MAVSVGDPRVPQQGGRNVRNWSTARVYVQDTWRVQRELTLNYGLGWEIDRDLNYDLRKPQLFVPLVGADGLGPPHKNWTNLSPVLGIAWSPMRIPKTVFRAGMGLYYEPLSSAGLDAERATLGAPGLGRVMFGGNSLQNSLPDIPGVSIGSTLNFAQPTSFSGADLLTILPGLRARLVQSLVNADPNLQAVQLTKNNSPGLEFSRPTTKRRLPCTPASASREKSLGTSL